MDKQSPAKIYGLIGYPVKHSLSPRMHNYAFRTLKINAEYRLFEVRPEDLEAFLLKSISVKDIEGNSINTRDISGFNITIPHKIKAKEILEREFPFNQGAFMINEDLYYVRLSGAVNTVKRVGNKLEYYNTDASGFLISLEHDLKFEIENKNVLLIGCGGVGRAIIASLSWRKTGAKKIYVNDIEEESVNSAKNYFEQFPHLRGKLEFILTSRISKVIQDCQLLVNATPVGMEDPYLSVVDKKLLREDLYIYDVVYNKEKETLLVGQAREICGNEKVIDGRRMLYRQGEASFEHWTDGKKFPAGTWEELEKELNKCQK